MLEKIEEKVLVEGERENGKACCLLGVEEKDGGNVSELERRKGDRGRGGALAELFDSQKEMRSERNSVSEEKSERKVVETGLKWLREETNNEAKEDRVSKRRRVSNLVASLSLSLSAPSSLPLPAPIVKKPSIELTSHTERKTDKNKLQEPINFPFLLVPSSSHTPSNPLPLPAPVRFRLLGSLPLPLRSQKLQVPFFLT